MIQQINSLTRLLRSQKEDKLHLGKIAGSFLKSEYLTERQLNHHTHIVGASGFGKTVLISHIVKQRISQGKGLLFIDLKSDMDTIEKFTQYAREANRTDDLEVFTLSDVSKSASYNLIADGTATQLRDRIILSLVWSEEYYKNQSSSFLLKLLILLCWLRDNKGFEFHLGTILDCASSTQKVVDFGNQIPMDQIKMKSHAQSLLDFLNQKDNFNSLQGLRVQIESIVLSDFGELIATSKSSISLFEAYQKSKIIFLFLDSRRYGETAKSIGKFILQDLKSVSAKVDAEVPKSMRRPFSVIIDEFSDLASEDFIGFLDRARSSRMSVVIAHQELCDLLRISPEFAGRLMGNTSTLYAFLQKRPESAEMISGIAGTKTVWKQTMQTQRLLLFNVDSGNGTKRETEEFIIHPNLIKSLGVGKCVCVKKYPTAQAYLVKVAEN